MNAHIEAAVQDYEGDCGMVAGDINEEAEMDAYYDSLAAMEDERHGRVPEKPERVPGLNEHLDELRPKEERFREEVRYRRERSKHRRMANRVLVSVARSHEQERIDMLGWTEGPMSSDTDFTPRGL